MYVSKTTLTMTTKFLFYSILFILSDIIHLHDLNYIDIYCYIRMLYTLILFIYSSHVIL